MVRLIVELRKRGMKMNEVIERYMQKHVIKTCIGICIDYNRSREETISLLIERFNLTKEDAEEYYEELYEDIVEERKRYMSRTMDQRLKDQGYLMATGYLLLTAVDFPVFNSKIVINNILSKFSGVTRDEVIECQEDLEEERILWDNVNRGVILKNVAKRWGIDRKDLETDEDVIVDFCRMSLLRGYIAAARDFLVLDESAVVSNIAIRFEISKAEARKCYLGMWGAVVDNFLENGSLDEKESGPNFGLKQDIAALVHSGLSVYQISQELSVDEETARKIVTLLKKTNKVQD